MGAACCIAAQDGSVSVRARGETVQRNVLYSPNWSFRWENRGRVAGEIENSSFHSSQRHRRNASIHIKREIDSQIDNISDEGSLLENIGTTISQKSSILEVSRSDIMNASSDNSAASTYTLEVKNHRNSSEITDSSAPKLSFSVPSSSQTHSLPPNSNPSRRACRSPGHQLFRQVSESRIAGLKSPNKSEGRPSFVLSTGSRLSTGSHGASSSDGGWSMRTFSELVANSQLQRWSFNSENLESSSRFSSFSSPSNDKRTCGACSKLLTERSSWTSNELSVSAVLVCGHVYHADCLETMTPQAVRYDPTCPICTLGQKQVLKMSRKNLKARNGNKVSRNRVVDSYLDYEDDIDDDFEVLDRKKFTEFNENVGKMEVGSSSRSKNVKPFLKRHFSIGSKWNRSLSENDSARKKGFWAKYMKD